MSERAKQIVDKLKAMGFAVGKNPSESPIAIDCPASAANGCENTEVADNLSPPTVHTPAADVKIRPRTG